MYIHFSSKADLLAALRSRYIDRLTAAVLTDRQAAGGTDTSHAVHRFVAGLFDFSLANRELHHLLFHEAAFSEDDAFAGARGSLAAVIADGAARGEAAVDDPDMADDFLLHGLHGLLVSALHGPRPNRKRFVQGAGDLATRLLSLPGAAVS